MARTSGSGPQMGSTGMPQDGKRDVKPASQPGHATGQMGQASAPEAAAPQTSQMGGKDQIFSDWASI